MNHLTLEEIESILAPSVHIDHQNVRPSAVMVTEFGVKHMAERLLDRFNEQLELELRESKKPKVSKQRLVHKKSGDFPHPTLCGQFMRFDFLYSSRKKDITCTKCLKKLKEKK